MKLWLSVAALTLACGSSPAAKEPESAGRVAFSDWSNRVNFKRQSLPDADGLGGAAWFDYDNDGDIDLFLTNGVDRNAALYQNDGSGHFTNVTAASGISATSGNTAAIAGDLDNDGFLDLVLVGSGGVTTPVRPSAPVLLQNNGDGTFRDVSAGSGVLPVDRSGNPLSASWSASLADPDGDGDLDLFITVPGNLWLAKQGSSVFYRNDGGFRFMDVTEASGLATANLGACASGFSDYDRDGDVDLFVGNCLKFRYSDDAKRVIYVDAAPVQLFRNDGELKFTEVTEESGLSSSLGEWMAVSYADFNHDGNIDFFSTDSGTVRRRPHGLFMNNGDGTFTNIAEQAGVANYEFSWGASTADFDNDGFADVFSVGSQPLPPSDVAGPGLANPGRLFLNQNREGHIVNAFVQNSKEGFALENQFTSGVATGDVDSDGFQDLLIVREQWPRGSDSGQPCLMRNQPNSNHWLGVRVRSASGNGFAIGARVTVLVEGGSCQVQEVYAGTSFGSTDSYRLSFGLNSHRSLRGIVVRWPSGAIERFASDSDEVDQTRDLQEGSGVPASEPVWGEDCQ